jgi:hypothetical protein
VLGGVQQLECCGRVALGVDRAEGQERHGVGAVVAIVRLGSGSDGGAPITIGSVGVAGVERDPARET